MTKTWIDDLWETGDIGKFVENELDRRSNVGKYLAHIFQHDIPPSLTYTEFLWALDGLGIELDFVTSNEMYNHYCKIKGA